MSQAFNNYRMSMGASVEHWRMSIHKTAWPNLLLNAYSWLLHHYLWDQNSQTQLVALHASKLIRIRPFSEHRYSPSRLLTGHEPDISHHKTFWCAVYVPIAPPQRTKMGPQRRMGIYVEYGSPTIIEYLEPNMGDLFKGQVHGLQV